MTLHTNVSRLKQAGERFNTLKQSPVNYTVSPCLRMCLLLPASPPPLGPPDCPQPHQRVPGDKECWESNLLTAQQGRCSRTSGLALNLKKHPRRHCLIPSEADSLTFNFPPPPSPCMQSSSSCHPREQGTVISLASQLCPSKDKEAGSVPAVRSKAPTRASSSSSCAAARACSAFIYPVPTAS